MELDKLRKKWLRKDEEGRTIKPYFFGHVAMTKGFYDSDRKNYMHHATAMDYLEELVDEYRSPTVKFDKLSLVDIIDFPEYNYKQAYYEQMKRILDDMCHAPRGRVSRNFRVSGRLPTDSCHAPHGRESRNDWDISVMDYRKVTPFIGV